MMMIVMLIMLMVMLNTIAIMMMMPIQLGAEQSPAAQVENLLMN